MAPRRTFHVLVLALLASTQVAQASFLAKVASKLRVRSLQKEQTQLRKSVLKARDRKLQERTAVVPAAGRGIWSSDSDSDSNSDMNYPSCLRTCDPNLLEEVDNAFNAGADAMSVDSPCGTLFHLMNNSCFSDACSDDPAFQAIMPIVDLCESFAGTPTAGGSPTSVPSPTTTFPLNPLCLMFPLLCEGGGSWFSSDSDVFDSDSCSGLINLTEETSPYTGSTVGSSNFMSLECSYSSGTSAGEVPFVYTLAPNSTLRLRQQNNRYDSTHELRYGGDCPGETLAQCVDDPDETMVEWTNESDKPVDVYYIQSGYGGGEGQFTLEWEVTAAGEVGEMTPLPSWKTDSDIFDSDSCSGMIDLAEETSPYFGSTTGSSNFMSLECSYSSGTSAGEIPFVYTLAPNSTLRLRQQNNRYDSVHELRYGGDCPGEFLVQCVDDPDTTMVEWTNESDEPVRVYYIQSGYGGGEGQFTLEWEVTAAGEVGEMMPAPTYSSPYSPTWWGYESDWDSYVDECGPYGSHVEAFQGFGCTAGDMPILTGFSSPECTPESFIGNPLGQIQALPYNDYCLPIDDLAMQLTCEQGVVTTRLFGNVNCSGTPARDMTFCNPYCDESDGSDSDSDAPPACLVESCASAGVAAVEASMQADEGILAVCEAVEVLYSSGCMRNCIGSDEVGELNVILNFCGLSPLGESSSSVPGSSPTQPPRTLSPTATPRTEVLFTQVFTELEIDAFADRAFDRQFRSDYTRSYAAAFNVEEDEVDILDIKSGSVVVDARVVTPSAERVEAMTAMLRDPQQLAARMQEVSAQAEVDMTQYGSFVTATVDTRVAAAPPPSPKRDNPLHTSEMTGGAGRLSPLLALAAAAALWLL